jgi:hypothetical protein
MPTLAADLLDHVLDIYQGVGFVTSRRYQAYVVALLG